MRCDQCHEREAVVFLTQIAQDQVIKLHLCERCAAEKGVETHGQPRQDTGGHLSGHAWGRGSRPMPLLRRHRPAREPARPAARP